MQLTITLRKNLTSLSLILRFHVNILKEVLTIDLEIRIFLYQTTHNKEFNKDPIPCIMSYILTSL